MNHQMNKSKILILFVVAHIILLSMVILMPNIQSGVSLQMFDLTMFKGFDLAYAQTFISELSDRGRSYYLFVQIPMDFLYPLLISTFFYLYFLDQTKNRKLAYLGFGSMIFDYLENIFVIVMLTTSSLTQGLVFVASMFTIIKAIFYAINYGLTVLLLGRYLYKKYQEMKPRMNQNT